MKVIDFEKKGNVVRFYLGADDLTDWWGDDWDDAPYDCNAGNVYERYVQGSVDIAFPFDAAVLEPCDGSANTHWTKRDMRSQKVPCLLVIHPEIAKEEPWNVWQFDYWAGSRQAKHFYFGLSLDELTSLAQEVRGTTLLLSLNDQSEGANGGETP